MLLDMTQFPRMEHGWRIPSRTTVYRTTPTHSKKSDLVAKGAVIYYKMDQISKLVQNSMFILVVADQGQWAARVEACRSKFSLMTNCLAEVVCLWEFVKFFQ